VIQEVMWILFVVFGICVLCLIAIFFALLFCAIRSCSADVLDFE